MRNRRQLRAADDEDDDTYTTQRTRASPLPPLHPRGPRGGVSLGGSTFFATRRGKLPPYDLVTL